MPPGSPVVDGCKPISFIFAAHCLSKPPTLFHYPSIAFDQCPYTLPSPLPPRFATPLSRLSRAPPRSLSSTSVSTGLKGNQFRRLSGTQFGQYVPSRQHTTLPPRPAQPHSAELHSYESLSYLGQTTTLSIAKNSSARIPLIIQVVTSTLQPMIKTLRWLAIFMIATLRERRDLALENLALRQQLGVLKRRHGVPRLKKGDRLFWVVLSRIWAPWRQALHMVTGDTVVGWQRKVFRIYWTRISQRGSPGRPQLNSEVRVLIKQMATANPYWGAPRIHGDCSSWEWRFPSARFPD